MANHKFVFFGSSDFSVTVLDTLKTLGLTPLYIVTEPDAPQGRGLVLLPNPAKKWALANKIPVLEPIVFDQTVIESLKKVQANYFLVASYGKILPFNVLNLAEKGTLNVHPSLLPKYRGASPVQAAILAGESKTGVTIIRLDEKMDHGPILSSIEVAINENSGATKMRLILAEAGAKLFVQIIDSYLEGVLEPISQDDKLATYTKKISKQDGEINLNDPALLNWRKYRAYEKWPGVYFFSDKGGAKKRIKISQAEYDGGLFKITKVIPEGKREMDFEAWKRGN